MGNSVESRNISSIDNKLKSQGSEEAFESALQNAAEAIPEKPSLFSPTYDAKTTPPRTTPTHNLDGLSAEDKEDEFTYTVEDLNPLIWIKCLLVHGEKQWEPPQKALPQKEVGAPKITLVLDLDETLVHCSMEELKVYDHKFPVQWNNQIYKIWARKRPGMEAFLEKVHKHFEIVVFTASQKVYADKVLDWIDPTHKWIKHRLFREHCRNQDGNYVKDLRILGRNMEHTIIVDNMPQAFAYQLDNGVPIEGWYDDNSDAHLASVAKFLLKMKHTEDVRPLIRERFGLRRQVEELSDRSIAGIVI